MGTGEQVIHEFYDNTKLASEKKCPRRYYYRHVRMWRTQGMAPPLVFGLSWHSAMDVVWPMYHNFSDPRDLAEAAMVAFNKTWVAEGAPPADEMSLEDFERWNPRVPAVAHEMLLHYIEQRKGLLSGSKIISCEAPFVVPLYEEETVGVNIWYAGRKDKKITTPNGERVVIEHKSTTDYKKDGGFKANYIESWYMASQIMGYLYSDNILSKGRTDYVWVDAALVHKNVHDAFRFIPVNHKYGQLDQWLYDTRKRVERIRRDTQVLTDLREAGKAHTLKFMPVFSRNEESCVDQYGKCPFFNVCTQYPNPEQQEEPPPGFIEEEWSPVDELGLQRLLKDDGSLKYEEDHVAEEVLQTRGGD